MKRINFLLIAFSLFIFTSCEQEDYEFGDILSPTNLTISASLQGGDAWKLLIQGKKLPKNASF